LDKKIMKNRQDPWVEVDNAMQSLEQDCKNSTQPTALSGHLFKMLKVQCLLARINDRSTRRVVWLTWGLLALTVALLLVAIGQMW
jgi:hypothetical protein